MELHKFKNMLFNRKHLPFKKIIKLFLSLGVTLILLGFGIYLKSYKLDKTVRNEPDLIGTYSESTISSTTTPTLTVTPTVTSFKISTTPTKQNTPSPTSTIITEQNPTQPQNSTSNINQSVNDSVLGNSDEDPYIQYLRDQEKAIQEKREYCNELYAEVTASIQPLLNTRDSINEKYSEAIAKGNVDQIGYYQQELANIQAQINAVYDLNYYSICP